MIVRKTAAELEKMRRSGLLVWQILQKLKDLAVEGASTMDLEVAAEKMVVPPWPSAALVRRTLPTPEIVLLNSCVPLALVWNASNCTVPSPGAKTTGRENSNPPPINRKINPLPAAPRLRIVKDPADALTELLVNASVRTPVVAPKFAIVDVAVRESGLDKVRVAPAENVPPSRTMVPVPSPTVVLAFTPRMPSRMIVGPV